MADRSRAEKAALAQRQAARKERTREWMVVGTVVAVVAAVILAFALWPSGDGDDGPTATAPTVGSSTEDGASDGASGDASGGASGGATAPEGAAQGDLVGEVTDDYGFAFGDPDAPHRVVVYEDFLCPFCGSLEAATNERLTELVDAGDVVVEYRVFDLLSRVGDYSLRAANALAVVMQEAGPRAAKTFHDLLYAQQPAETGPLPDDEWLVDQAVVAGAAEDAVRPGIEDLAFGDFVAEATQAAADSGVQSTPTVLVDGETVDGTTIQGLSDAIFAAVD